MLCKKLHHCAYRCADARQTVDFYTEVLGLKFSHAVGGDHVPSTGEYDPHIHVFFEMEDGSSIAFFEVPNSPGGMKDEVMPDWIQHFAFEVDSIETLERAKATPRSPGPVGGRPHRPRLHPLDLLPRPLAGTASSSPPARPGPRCWTRFAADAPHLLELWEKTKDWSLVGDGQGSTADRPPGPQRRRPRRRPRPTTTS